jgi:hypothetical protein
LFKGFTNTNPLIKTVSRPAGTAMAGFSRHGLPSNLKLGRDGCVPEEGLVARFRADTNVTLNGSNVAAWADMSGTYTLTQPAAGSQPVFAPANATPFLSNKPAVYLGNGKSLTVADTFGIDAEPVRGVFAILYNQAYNNVTGGLISFSNGGSGSYTLFGYDGSFGQYSMYYNPPSATLLRPAQLHYVYSPWLFGIEINRAAGQVYSYHYNSIYDNKAIVTTLTNYSTGNFYVTGNTTGWYLAELLIYNQSIATAPFATRNNLLYYVKNHYGLG